MKISLKAARNKYEIDNEIPSHNNEKSIESSRE